MIPMPSTDLLSSWVLDHLLNWKSIDRFYTFTAALVIKAKEKAGESLPDSHPSLSLSIVLVTIKEIELCFTRKSVHE
jgi:hypothetical protein